MPIEFCARLSLSSFREERRGFSRSKPSSLRGKRLGSSRLKSRLRSRVNSLPSPARRGGIPSYSLPGGNRHGCGMQDGRFPGGVRYGTGLCLLSVRIPLFLHGGASGQVFSSRFGLNSTSGFSVRNSLYFPSKS